VRALRWTEHAVAQLESIAEYVSLSSPVYAEQLLDRIARRLDQAREFPESGRVVPEFARPDIRELIEWPYRLVYRVHPDTIEVLSVLHGRQGLRELR
jgi:plasmid stabilization system protein ParE